MSLLPNQPPTPPTSANFSATLRQLLWETGLTAWVLLLGLAGLMYLSDRNPWFTISDVPTQPLAISLGLGGLLCLVLSFLPLASPRPDRARWGRIGSQPKGFDAPSADNNLSD